MPIGLYNPLQFIMRATYLKLDEFELECRLRNIDPTRGDSYDKLEDMLNRNIPIDFSQAPRIKSRLNDEISKLHNLYDELSNDLREAERTADLSVYPIIETRICHLKNRLDMLKCRSQNLPILSQMEINIESLMSQFVGATNEIIGAPAQLSNPENIDSVVINNQQEQNQPLAPLVNSRAPGTPMVNIQRNNDFVTPLINLNPSENQLNSNPFRVNENRPSQVSDADRERYSLTYRNSSTNYNNNNGGSTSQANNRNRPNNGRGQNQNRNNRSNRNGQRRTNENTNRNGQRDNHVNNNDRRTNISNQNRQVNVNLANRFQNGRYSEPSGQNQRSDARNTNVGNGSRRDHSNDYDFNFGNLTISDDEHDDFDVGDGGESNNQRQSSERRRTVVSSWNISFSGSDARFPVEEFIFRTETMAEGEGVTDAALALNLHYLLTGNALTWYWLFKRRNGRTQWHALKNALRKEFGGQETDYEIRKTAENRKQLFRESFSDFRLVIETMVARMRRPISEREKISILRRNMRADLQKALIMHHFESVVELRDACRKHESLWSQLGDVGQQFRRRAIAEIQNCDDDVDDQFDYDDVEEINENPVNHQLRDQTYYVCWNCRELGHAWQNCPSTQRTIFCYSCGKQGVVKPNCPKCNPGNIQPNPIMRSSRVVANNQAPPQTRQQQFQRN